MTAAVAVATFTAGATVRTRYAGDGAVKITRAQEGYQWRPVKATRWRPRRWWQPGGKWWVATTASGYTPAISRLEASRRAAAATA